MVMFLFPDLYERGQRLGRQAIIAEPEGFQIGQVSQTATQTQAFGIADAVVGQVHRDALLSLLHTINPCAC